MPEDHMLPAERRTDAPLPAEISDRIAQLPLPAEIEHPAEAEQAVRRAQALLDVMRRGKSDLVEQVRVLRRIIELAIRGADLVDEMRARGELVDNPGGKDASELRTRSILTLADLGLSRQRLAEWKSLRDNGALNYLDQVLADGQEDLFIRASVNWLREECERLARGTPWVAYNGGNDGWRSPPEILEAARSALGGGFDLDPASSPDANRLVRAKRIFTAEDDALTQDWPVGRIWMNPPYTLGLIDQFAARLVDAVRRGSNAITLVNNGTETRWAQSLLAECAAVCFPRGRIKYLDERGRAGSSGLQGQAILYLGPDPAAFRDAFAGFGEVLPGPNAWEALRQG